MDRTCPDHPGVGVVPLGTLEVCGVWECDWSRPRAGVDPQRRPARSRGKPQAQQIERPTLNAARIERREELLAKLLKLLERFPLSTARRLSARLNVPEQSARDLLALLGAKVRSEGGSGGIPRKWALAHKEGES